MAKCLPYLAAVILYCLIPLSSATAKPNVIVLLADDQGWGDFTSTGNTDLRTPNIDSLADDGARFRYFYVEPVCSPTRAEFLTGRYHLRVGVNGVSTGAERLNLNERTVADAFQNAGYKTACFGKWHNGAQYPYHPNARGFEEYYGFPSGHWGEYYDPPLDHNGKAVQGTGYLPDDLTNRAIQFVEQQAEAGKPFFCYVAYNIPHSPMQVPDLYWDRFKDKQLKFRGDGKENLAHTRAALAMCENLDDNVGKLINSLETKGIAEDTIIVYYSDNGPNGPRWNGGLKGRKGSTDEGGVRSPLHIRWPAKIPQGTVVEPISAAIDLYPTLIDLAGIERVGDKPLDGISMAPWLLGQSPKMPERVLFQHWNGRISARNQQYRLDHTGKLYDIINDHGQTKNLANQEPVVLQQLQQAANRWKAELFDPFPKQDDRPFPVGYAEFPRTVLPARDGVPHSGVRRSAPAPNCSFFTDWTDTNGLMTWNVEVNQPGKYEAIVLYTCPENSVGSTIKLSIGQTEWSGQITEAHDPPLHGEEHDRVNRGPESYVKDFRPLSLGVMTLDAGRDSLKLQAIKVPGEYVADVRAVELILVEPKQQ